MSLVNKTDTNCIPVVWKIIISYIFLIEKKKYKFDCYGIPDLRLIE